MFKKKEDNLIKSCVKIMEDNIVELPQIIQSRCKPGDIVCMASKVDSTNPLKGQLKAWIRLTDGGKDIDGKDIFEWADGEGDEVLQKELIKRFKR